MDNNHTDDYVLVLEDRTEVKNEAEVGKLSVSFRLDKNSPKINDSILPDVWETLKSTVWFSIF